MINENNSSKTKTEKIDFFFLQIIKCKQKTN